MKKVSTVAIAALVFAALVFTCINAPAQQRPMQDRPENVRPLPEGQQVRPRDNQMPGNRPNLNRPGRNANPNLEKQPPVIRQQMNRQQLQMEVMRRIGLNPDQQARLRDIRDRFGDNILIAGRNVRESRRALDRAIMSPQFDEAMINQKAQELARAQSEMILLQARLRAQVRGVLTPEQVGRFIELERRLRQLKREQNLKRQEERENDGPRGDNLLGPPPPPDEFEEEDLAMLLAFGR